MTDLFKEKAKDWDANSKRMQLSRAISGAILEHVAFNTDMDVLDFGAGTGLVTSQIAPLVHTVTAVDISESMLEKLKEKNELKDKVSTICQDITKYPLSQKFDVIVSAMAMHHVEDTKDLLQKLASHLKPGGQIAIADLDTEDGSFHSAGTEGVFHNGFERDSLRASLEEIGFKSVRFVTAHTILGEKGSYPIFLMLGSKS